MDKRDIRLKVGEEFMRFLNEHNMPLKPYGHYVDKILEHVEELCNNEAENG